VDAAFLLTSLLISAGAPSEDYEPLMKKAQALLAKSDLEEARAAAKEAFTKCGDPPEGGQHAMRAKALLGEIEVKRKRFKTAAHEFKEAMRFALDDHHARGRMLAKRRAAYEKASDKLRMDLADQIAKHDAVLLATLRKPFNPEGKRAEVRAQLASAMAVYKAEEDPIHVQWAAAARALVSAKSGAPDEALQEARPIADDKNTYRAVRATALEAIQSAALAKEDVDAATRAALMLNAALSESMPEDRRRYVRMKGLDTLCGRYEGEHGAGSCARLERESTGRYTFTDLSVGRVRKELSDDDLDRAHRQFLPAIEDCVLTSARANRDAYQSTDIQISWAIQPKGQASDIDIKPKRYERELMPCVEERIAWFRYPRYTSPERKTVTIPYHLD
jgi:hypothetical protein